MGFDSRGRSGGLCDSRVTHVSGHGSPVRSPGSSRSSQDEWEIRQVCAGSGGQSGDDGQVWPGIPQLWAGVASRWSDCCISDHGHQIPGRSLQSKIVSTILNDKICDKLYIAAFANKLKLKTSIY